MREIKFKVWDKREGLQEMYYCAYPVAYGEGWKGGNPEYKFYRVEHSNGFFLGNAKDLVILQFTGFKDIKGTEIFDGDIIGDWNNVDGKMEQSRQTVFFDETTGQWMLDCSFKQDKSMSTSLFAELTDCEFEVLGNIYKTIF